MKTIQPNTGINTCEMTKNPCIQFLFAYQEHDLDKMMSSGSGILQPGKARRNGAGP